MKGNDIKSFIFIIFISAIAGQLTGHYVSRLLSDNITQETIDSLSKEKLRIEIKILKKRLENENN